MRPCRPSQFALRAAFVHYPVGANRDGVELYTRFVPDSGSGELAGLSGSMQIIIADGKHSYEFSYTLAPA